MTRQDYIKKWFSYGVTLVLVAVLQGLVFTRLRVFGLIPMLLPLALVALATLDGVNRRFSTLPPSPESGQVS